MSSASFSANYEAIFLITTRDSDCFSKCQASALLSFLQETGLRAMGNLGLTRELMLQRYQTIWMLSRTHYSLEEAIYLGDTVIIRGRCRSAHGMGLYYDCEILREGVKIGEALSLWLPVDEGQRTLYPASQISELSDILNDIHGKQLRAPTLPEPLFPIHQRTVEYSQVDMNGHLNNSRYADLICNAVGLDKLRGAYVSSLKISYLSECLPGCLLTIFARNDGKLWFVKGEGEDGLVKFKSEAELAYPASNELLGR